MTFARPTIRSRAAKHSSRSARDLRPGRRESVSADPGNRGTRGDRSRPARNGDDASSAGAQLPAGRTGRPDRHHSRRSEMITKRRAWDRSNQDFEKSKLRLARVISLPTGQLFKLVRRSIRSHARDDTRRGARRTFYVSALVSGGTRTHTDAENTARKAVLVEALRS